MADDQVMVEFGAKIDALISGVAQVNGKLDEVGKHTGDLHGQFDSLKHYVAEAFSVTAILEFIHHMGELGLQTERVMATLGTTAEQTLMLAGEASLTGSSMQGLALSIERMSLNMQRATVDGINPQAQALHVLGLSAKDFQNISTDKYIDRLHDAVSKFNPSLNLTNAIMQIGGRGVAQIIPLLQMSGERWEEMRQRITGANVGMAQIIPRMAETHAGVSILGLSIQSMGAQIYSVFQPAIDAAVKILTTYVQVIRDSIKDHGTWYYLLEGISFVTKLLVSGFASLAAAIEIVTIQAKAFWSYFSKNQVADVTKEIEAAVKRLRESLTSVWNPPAHVTTGKEGQNAGAMNEAARQQLEATIKNIETENALWKGWLEQTKTVFQASADFYEMTERQKLAATMRASQEAYSAEVANLMEIKRIYQSAGLDKEVAATNQKIRLLEQQHATEMIKINADMVRDIKSRFDDMFGALQSSFNSQLRGLLAGTTSFAEAFKSILGDMVIYFIQAVEKMVFNWIAAQIAMAVNPMLPAKQAAFTSDIVADAARVYAGVFASLAPVMGPAAAGPAGVAMADVTSLLALVPKFEMGTDYVPKTGLAMVHEGEQIITAGENPSAGGNLVEQIISGLVGIGGIGGSEGDTHLHLHGMMIDGPSVNRFFKNYADVIWRILTSKAKLAP